jgi:hypothetical protein
MELNVCEIKIIEDDDPGRFEFARPNYTFKSGLQKARIPVIRSMGADGKVEVPWKISSPVKTDLPVELQGRVPRDVQKCKKYISSNLPFLVLMLKKFNIERTSTFFCTQNKVFFRISVQLSIIDFGNFE